MVNGFPTFKFYLFVGLEGWWVEAGGGGLCFGGCLDKGCCIRNEGTAYGRRGRM